MSSAISPNAIGPESQPLDISYVATCYFADYSNAFAAPAA